MPNNDNVNNTPKKRKRGRPKGSSKKMGRPKKNIDKAKFEEMCADQCTEVEIAGAFGVSTDTINNWCKATYGLTFSEVFAKKRQVGFVSLRHAQFEMAKKNVVMAIFLGKNYLGQSDNPEPKMDENTEVDSLSAALRERAKKL